MRLHRSPDPLHQRHLDDMFGDKPGLQLVAASFVVDPRRRRQRGLCHEDD